MKRNLIGYIFVLASVVLGTAMTAHAGADNRDIRCVTKKGIVVVEGNVPGDIEEWSIVVSDGKKRHELTEENSTLTVNEEPEKQFYSLVAETKPGEKSYLLFALTSVPKTLKNKTIENGDILSFKATATLQWVQGKEAGQADTKHVTCVGKYEI